MKKELSENKATERKKLLEFVAASKKKAQAEKIASAEYCRIVYFRHVNYEEEDYTYGFN